MRGELPPLTRESMYPRRVGARALGIVLAHYSLEGVALKFNPDDPEQVFPGAAPGEVRFYEDGGHTGKATPVAYVFLVLEDLKARVIIEKLRDVVRRAHRKDFRPEELGVFREPRRPDVDMEVELQSILDELGEAVLVAPQRGVQRRRRRSYGALYASALGRGRRR
jgi:hypothetical protein